MWRDIKDYEGLYEINENAVVRRVEGKGIDGRKVTTHVVVSSKTRKGTRYIALWKNGNRKTFMLHKLYAEAFYMSENEACRRLYKGFIGYGQAVQNVKDILLKNLSDLEKEQAIGENRHDEILYIQQFLDEFLEALQSAISQMSVDGIRISHVTSKTRELSKYMGQVLDEDWKKARGIEIQSVGIASISYDEESQKLINMRNQGAMMGDPNIREGFVQSSIAKGLEAAGSNANGAMAGYMGMGMGIQGAGGFMNAASNTNMQQMQQQAQYQQMMNQQQAQQMQQAQYGQPQGGQQPSGDTWTCTCGAVNTGNFCPNCGGRRPAPAAWTCTCGAVNTGKFCPNCGKPRP